MRTCCATSLTTAPRPAGGHRSSNSGGRRRADLAVAACAGITTLAAFPRLDVADHHHQVAILALEVLDQVFEHRLAGKAGMFKDLEGCLGLQVDLRNQLLQAEFLGQLHELVD